ncbi:MAG: galactose-1-phosphate uridylyltransferase [Actinobacteria bacterium]|nr:galactose-1-phosphate uridylyltransferase [Actinomycetota bacterium]
MPATTLAAGVVRRDASLADGRELFYYDDPGTLLPPQRAVDTRVLDPRPETAELRYDALTGDWISVATARQHRAFLPPANLDPLAPQRPGNPSEVPSNYDVAVFENKSPSFGPALASAPIAAAPDELDEQRASEGRCEVVCFSPEHEGSFGTLSTVRARTVIEAWADRVSALQSLSGVAQVFPFENRGTEIGVTLPHPHGQIYAYPYITPRTRRLLERLEEHGAGLFARILEREQSSGRVVLAGRHWCAYVPFAARWPIEVQLLPYRQIPDLAETTAAERDELAVLYPRLLRGLDALYDTPTPYIAAWHQAPKHALRAEVRLRLEVTSPRRAADRLKYLAGSEAAMGAWVADVAPESQAERLREAVARADARAVVGEA